MARIRPSARVIGLIRLVHPFPSLLDGAVVAVVALAAGGSLGDSVRLAASMTLLQFGIGAVNDVVDARRDVGREHHKPIPAGWVTAQQARGVAAASAIGGIALVVPSLAMVLLAVLVLGIGLAYDFRAKGTALSWLPFAVGIPILPVYGWLGASDTLPPLFAVLVPVAAIAGAALAISNALVDLERDRAAGTGSIAVALGAVPSAVLALALHSIVGVTAITTLDRFDAPSYWVVITAGAAAVPLLGALVGAAAARGRDPAIRERAWEIQAVGAGLLATAWVAAVTAAGPV